MYNKLTTERSGPMSHLKAKINTSLQYMNTDVQLASNVIYSGTTKFLCKSFDSLAIVNITFHNEKMFMPDAPREDAQPISGTNTILTGEIKN